MTFFALFVLLAATPLVKRLISILIIFILILLRLFPTSLFNCCFLPLCSLFLFFLTHLVLIIVVLPLCLALALAHELGGERTLVHRVLVLHSFSLWHRLHSGGNSLYEASTPESLENKQSPIVETEIVSAVEQERDGWEVRWLELSF